MPPRGDFVDLLLKRMLVDLKLVAEAEKLSNSGNLSLADALIKLGVPAEDVARALAEYNGMQYVSLSEYEFPPGATGLLAESMAREMSVVPLSGDEQRVKIAVSDPFDLDLQDKLRFVVNRRIDFV